MANESLQAAQARNRDVPTGAPTAKQDCSDIVNISMFFDGTGNNRFVDGDDPKYAGNPKSNPKKWSNVARLWRSAIFETGDEIANYPIYISGVGTPFNGTATDWLDQAEITVGDTAFGNFGGGGGTRRTEFGQNNVNNTLRQVLLNNAKKLGGTTKAYADKSKNQSLSELSRALEPHRLIKIINLSIFGFSRGAALGRAFCNDFISLCQKDDKGQLLYNKVPVRIHFMGLFDTVASFGVPSANMDGLFSEKSLKVPSQAERCVHYVAAHELRFSFPVDLICQHGRLMPNWTETVYPGVHSDVGGGYVPLKTDGSNDNSLNQGISNNYARIPMRDMMSEAVRAGVRMLSYGDVEKASNQIFTERFAIEPKTEETYRHYMASVPANGAIEEVITAHMKALYSAYGTMTRRGIKTPDKVASKGSVKHALFGHEGMAQEAEAFQHSGKAVKLIASQANLPHALQFLGTTYSQVVRPERWRLEAWNSDANDAIVTFIQNWVHDSKAGFIHSVEPFSYFRPRGMTESSRNVLAKGMQWLDQNVEAAKGGVLKIYYSAEGVVVETWEKGTLIATKTYKVGEKFAVDTVNAGEKYAVEVYQTSKQVVISTVDAGQQLIVTSVNAAQKKASELATAAQKSVSDMAQQVGDGAKQVSDAIGNKVDAGMKAVEDGWKATRASLGF